jgi:hypothetical protein
VNFWLKILCFDGELPIYNLDTQKFYKRQNVAQGSQKYYLGKYFKMEGISKLAFGDFLMKIVVFPCKLFSVELIFGLIGGFLLLDI